MTFDDQAKRGPQHLVSDLMLEARQALDDLERMAGGQPSPRGETMEECAARLDRLVGRIRFRTSVKTPPIDPSTLIPEAVLDRAHRRVLDNQKGIPQAFVEVDWAEDAAYFFILNTTDTQEAIEGRNQDERLGTVRLGVRSRPNVPYVVFKSEKGSL